MSQKRKVPLAYLKKIPEKQCIKIKTVFDSQLNEKLKLPSMVTVLAIPKKNSDKPLPLCSFDAIRLM